MSTVDDALEVWDSPETYAATVTLTSLRMELKPYAVEAVQLALELVTWPPVQAGNLSDSEILSVVVHMANSGAVPLGTSTPVDELAERVRRSLVGAYPTEQKAAAEAVRMVGGYLAAGLRSHEEAALADPGYLAPAEVIRRADNACARLRPGATWREISSLGYVLFMLY